MNPLSVGSLMRGAGALRTTFEAGKSALASSQTAAAIAPHMRQMLGKLKDFKPSDLSAMMSRASRFVEGLKGPVPGPGPSPSVAGHTMLRRPLSANRLQSQFRADQATHGQSRPVPQASMSNANATTNAKGDANPATNTGDGHYADGAPRDGGKSPGPAGASANAHINATTNARGETSTAANTGDHQYADGAPHDGSKSPGPADASANADINATTNATGDTDIHANGNREHADGAPPDSGKSPWPAGIGENPTPADFIPHIFPQAVDIIKSMLSSGEHSGMVPHAFARNILHHVMPGLTQLSNIVAPGLAQFDKFWKDAYRGAESGDPQQAQESREALDVFRKHTSTGANNALGLLDAAATPGATTSEQQRINQQQARARQNE
jgi:hypothetical protein